MAPNADQSLFKSNNVLYDSIVTNLAVSIWIYYIYSFSHDSHEIRLVSSQTARLVYLYNFEQKSILFKCLPICNWDPMPPDNVEIIDYFDKKIAVKLQALHFRCTYTNVICMYRLVFLFNMLLIDYCLYTYWARYDEHIKIIFGIFSIVIFYTGNYGFVNHKTL